MLPRVRDLMPVQLEAPGADCRSASSAIDGGWPGPALPVSLSDLAGNSVPAVHLTLKRVGIIRLHGNETAGVVMSSNSFRP